MEQCQIVSYPRCGASVSMILGSLGLAAGRVAWRPDNPYDGNYSPVVVVVAAASVCWTWQ